MSRDICDLHNWEGGTLMALRREEARDAAKTSKAQDGLHSKNHPAQNVNSVKV